MTLTVEPDELGPAAWAGAGGGGCRGGRGSLRVPSMTIASMLAGRGAIGVCLARLRRLTFGGVGRAAAAAACAVCY